MSLRFIRSAAAISLLAVLMPAGHAVAADYPNRPIHWIVPFSPGGATDIVARVVGKKLSEAWGQSVIVENKPGGGGIVGANVVATAAPDGYTIGGVSLNFTIYPVLYKDVPFDIFKNFSPVTLVAKIPSILVVYPKLPIYSVKDLIKEAKAHPGTIGFASGGGVGTGGHVAGELFKKMTGVDMTHIPYKGGGPATIDLIGGHVQISFATTTSIITAVRAGQVRAIAVTSAKRFPLLPDLPTVAESGVPGFDTEEMQGIVAPAGVPKEILAKLNTEIVKILQMPDVKAILTNLGATPQAGTPEDFSKYLHAEVNKWRSVFKGSAMSAK